MDSEKEQQAEIKDDIIISSAQEENKSDQISISNKEEVKKPNEEEKNKDKDIQLIEPNQVIVNEEPKNQINDDNINNDKKEPNNQIEKLVIQPQKKLKLQIKSKEDYKLFDNNYTDLKFIDLKGEDINAFYVFDSKNLYDNINSITFKNCNFLGEPRDEKGKPKPRPESSLNKPIHLKYLNSFPELTESINDFLPFPLMDHNSNFQLLSLRIEKSNIVTSEYSNIINNIFNDDRMRKNIRSISFAENQIVSVDLKRKFAFSYDKLFNSLEELNFYGNRIYSFRLSYAKAVNKDKFKFVNLIDNQFSSFTELDLPKASIEKIIVLLNRNLLLTIDENLVKYNEYLKLVIPDFSYASFTFMSLSGLFTQYDSQNIKDYIINNKTLETLIELDLSYCGLNITNASVFFDNHKTMVNLKKLGLRTNFLDDKILRPKENGGGLPYFEHLRELDLSNNAIEDQLDYQFVYEFIVKHRELIHMNLQMNPLGREYTADNNNKKSGHDKGKNKDKEKDKENEDEGDLGNVMVYTTKEFDKEKEKKYNFVRLVQEIYCLRPNFQLDFSTESRLFVYADLKKKNYSYEVKVKQKKAK